MPDSTVTHTPQPQEFNIRDYWQILVRRRWLIYTCVLVTTVAAAVSSFLATPTYRSTCVVSIERSGARILSKDLAAVEPSWMDYQNFYNTQYRIIGSDEVLRRAIDRLELMKRNDLPGGNPGETSGLAAFKSRIMKAVSRSSVPSEEEDQYHPYIKMIRAGMGIDPVRDSHLVEISFVSSDRRFAAEVANAIAKAYVSFIQRSKLDIAEQSKEFFVEQITLMKNDIGRLEQDLQEYARAHSIVTGDKDDAAIQNFNSLRDRTLNAQAAAAQARARYEILVKTPPEAIDLVRQSAVIQTLTQELANSDRELREKAATFGDDFPEVQKLRAKVEAARDKLASESLSIALQVTGAAQAEMRQREREAAGLQALLDRAKTDLGTLQAAYVEYTSRKAEVDRKRVTLNELLEKQNNMQLSANLDSLGDAANNVRIIDKAYPARQIFKPKKKLNILLGFLFGLFLGIGGAVVMEYIDNTLKTPEDVRNQLRLAVLGMIPAQETESRAGGKVPRKVRGPTSAKADADPALITANQPLSPTAEAFRELRTALLLATAGHPPRDLTVTSCQPSEGKTTTIINIAIALGQLGRRVLLVDTDLRRPRCHQVLKVSGSKGVSTYLTGMSDLPPLIQPTSLERVSIVAAGPIPPNPAELLDSARFKEFIDELRAREDFDHILFDSPPVLSVVDPILIGRHTEGVVLVVKSAFTSREAGRLGREKLEAGRLNLLGVVLNAVQVEHVPYQYRYYRYGYSRGAGKGSEPPKTTDSAEGTRA